MTQQFHSWLGSFRNSHIAPLKGHEEAGVDQGIVGLDMYVIWRTLRERIQIYITLICK